MYSLNSNYSSCRFYKPSSRNWIIDGSRRCRGASQLPPLYPRRGSNTPISSLALASHPSNPPSRSRSLDGLLDDEASQAAKSDTNPSHSFDNLNDKMNSDSNDCNAAPSDAKETMRSSSESEDYNASQDCDKSSVHSSSSDSKRKRNFMDRCVNKVRSFIGKWIIVMRLHIWIVSSEHVTIAFTVNLGLTQGFF